MAFAMTWLADALRGGGCKVQEIDGWQDRGRGEMGVVRGVLLHHTAGPVKGDHPSLDLVVKGRSDLPGPLSQLFLARDGTFFVIAAGRCNHAGAGSWQGVTSGNGSFVGIEAENAGTGKDPWPEAQMDAYERGVAAILKHIGADDVMAAGHKEYALPRGRKIDPAFDMVAFRENVARIMADRGRTASPAAVDPARSMLRKGDQGNSVRELQTMLGRWFMEVTKGDPKVAVDGTFGPTLDQAVRMFQHKNGLTVDGLVGPSTWKALGV